MIEAEAIEYNLMGIGMTVLFVGFVCVMVAWIFSSADDKATQ
jgi:hypothetical protein